MDEDVTDVLPQNKILNHLAALKEVFKNRGDNLTQALFELFIRIWESKVILADLRDANSVTVLKKRNKSECGDYSGMSLSIAGNILARLVSYRLSKLTEVCLPESQSGFMLSHGTVDMLFAARQIQEKF